MAVIATSAASSSQTPAAAANIRRRGKTPRKPRKPIHARRGRLTLLSAVRELDGSHLPILLEAVLQALREEDTEDREPTSPPCYAHQTRD